MRYYLGIDPGFSGGLALYDPMLETLKTIEMPTLKAGTGSKKVINETELARFFDNNAKSIRKVIIERVHAMPKQGVTSSFNFGMNYGIVHGMITANFIPKELVTPQKWKKALRVPANKDGARARASEIFPQYSDQWSLKKWDGRAEAAMIAKFGAEELKN